MYSYIFVRPYLGRSIKDDELYNDFVKFIKKSNNKVHYHEHAIKTIEYALAFRESLNRTNSNLQS